MSSLMAQESRDYLKTEPFIEQSTPSWAVEMYQENPNVFLVDQLYENYYQVHAFVKNIHTQNYKHWRRHVERFLSSSGYLEIPSVDIQRKRKTVFENKQNQIQRSGNSWNPIGPFDTYSTDENQTQVSWQANVYAIDQSKSNPDIIYVGSEAGGIFKSIDKGMNWNFASFNSTLRSIRSVKVDPANPDIVYAGDGSAIYKTVDGGQEWIVLYEQGSLNVNDFAINPSNTNIIHAATNQGLLRSDDAGSSWTEILNETIWDIELNYSDPSEVYILRSNPSAIRTEFWKSTDGGLNYSLKDNGWYSSTDPNRNNGGARMTVTPADPDRIYVILVGASKADDHGFIGVYRSEDSGENWAITNPPVGGPYNDNHNNLATLSNTNFLQQGYYNLGIAASHDNPDEFLVGCLNLWRSTDAGGSFTALGGYQGSVSWIHPDQQEIEINGNDMWVVNDGGINYSNDLFTSHESRKTGLNASEFWGFGSSWNEDLIVGGRYHNGNTAYRPSFEDGRFLRLGGGEASTGYVQPGGDQVAFFSDISAKKIPFNLNDAVQNVGGLSMFPSESYFASHYSELEFASNCYGHIFLGNDNKLWKSEDNGGTFNLIQEFGDSGQPLMQFEISREDNNVMYAYQRVAFYEAVLWVSTDGGSNWNQKSFPDNVSSMRAGSVTIHGQNPGTLWVSFGHQNNDGNKIFRTDDYGDSWTNISDPILDGETIHAVFHHAGTESDLYIGTNLSMYYYDGANWSACNDGLPTRLNTNRFAPFYRDNKLRVATYGNGVWETELMKKTSPLAQATVNKTSSNCARDTFYFDDYSVLQHDSDVSWAWEFSPTPDYISDVNARNPKVVFGAIGTFDVNLSVQNSQGSDQFSALGMVQITEDICRPDIYPDLAGACFQSGDDYVQLPNMDMITDEFTLSAWIKPQGIQSDYTGIIFNDDVSTGLNFSTGNQLGFHYEDAGSAAWAWSSNLFVPTDEWSYVAMVVTPEGVTLYLNGEPAYRDVPIVPATLGTMKIGSYKGWGSRNFNGLIDEVTIWDKSLTIEQIRNHRHITKSMENADGLKHYYQFNESSGQVLDRINLKHGTLNGSMIRDISYAPVGRGTALSLQNDQGAMLNFSNEKLNLNPTMGANDMLTATRLSIAPQNNNVTEAYPMDSYWLLNMYGNFSIEEINISDDFIESYYETNASEIVLYERPANHSESLFEENGSGIEVLSGMNGYVLISGNYQNDIQFSLSKATITSIKDNALNEAKVFPNPTRNLIQIEGIDQEVILRVYDAKGNQVLYKLISNKEKVEAFEHLKSGQYYYTLESDNQLKTGKITIIK